MVADALNCQKETAEIVVNRKADYLLCVKDNHPNLKIDIFDYFKDEWQKGIKNYTKTKKTEEELKLVQLLSQQILFGLNSERSGNIYILSVQFIVKLKRKKERRKNGIIICRAVN